MKIEKENMCNIHNYPYEYFCIEEKCSLDKNIKTRFCCKKCITGANAIHKSHQIEDIQDI